MTATLPDYKRDPPELERDMPGAHLEAEAGQFMFRVSVLDSAFNLLRQTKKKMTEHQAIQPDLLTYWLTSS